MWKSTRESQECIKCLSAIEPSKQDSSKGRADVSFELQKGWTHGWQASATALAHDPVQSLLAVGLADGHIWIYGKVQVEVCCCVGEGLRIDHLVFQINKGVLLAFSSTTIFRIGLLQSSPTVQRVFTAKYSISTIHLPCNSDWLYLGTIKGNVLPVSIEFWEESRSVIYWNSCVSNHSQKHPGSVLCIAEKPSDSSKLLIGHASGNICIYDTYAKALVGTYGWPDDEHLASLCWHPTLDMFISGHSSGKSAVWKVKGAAPEGVFQVEGKKANGTPASSAAPFRLAKWIITERGALLVYGGGEAHAGSLHPLSVVDSNWVEKGLLFLDSPIVDTAVLCSSPWPADSGNVGGIAVLQEHQLAIYDIADQCMRQLNPICANFALSGQVCHIMTCSDVDPSFFLSLKRLTQSESKYGDAVKKPWPLKGGEINTTQLPSSWKILFLGYTDGRVSLVDATGSSLLLLHTFCIEDICVHSNVAVPHSCAVTGLTFCSQSRILAVAVASGEVLVLRYAEKSGQAVVLTCCPASDPLFQPIEPKRWQMEISSSQRAKDVAPTANNIKSPLAAIAIASKFKKQSVIMNDRLDADTANEIIAHDISQISLDTQKADAARTGMEREESETKVEYEMIAEGDREQRCVAKEEGEAEGEKATKCEREKRRGREARMGPLPFKKTPSLKEIVWLRKKTTALSPSLGQFSVSPKQSLGNQSEDDDEFHSIPLVDILHVRPDYTIHTTETTNETSGKSAKEKVGTAPANQEKSGGAMVLDDENHFNVNALTLTKNTVHANSGFQVVMCWSPVKVKQKQCKWPIKNIAINSAWSLLALCLDAGVILIGYKDGQLVLSESFVCEGTSEQKDSPTAITFAALRQREGGPALPALLVSTEKGYVLRYALIPKAAPKLLERINMELGPVLGTAVLSANGGVIIPPTSQWVDWDRLACWGDLEFNQSAVNCEPKHDVIIAACRKGVASLASPSDVIMSHDTCGNGRLENFAVLSVDGSTFIGCLETNKQLAIFSLPRVSKVATIDLSSSAGKHVLLHQDGEIWLWTHGVLERTSIVAGSHWQAVRASLPIAHANGPLVPPPPLTGSMWSIFGIYSAQKVRQTAFGGETRRYKRHSGTANRLPPKEMKKKSVTVASVMGQNQQLMGERGKQLSELDDKTELIARAARQWAARVRENNAQLAAKKWYEL